jgi:hypothetical protein
MKQTIYRCDICKTANKITTFSVNEKDIDLCYRCIVKLARRSLTEQLFKLVFCNLCKGTRTAKEFYFNNDYNLVDCDCVKKLKDESYGLL